MDEPSGFVPQHSKKGSPAFGRNSSGKGSGGLSEGLAGGKGEHPLGFSQMIGRL